MIRSITVTVPHSYEPGDQATLPFRVDLEIPPGDFYTLIVDVEGIGQVKEPVSSASNTVSGYLKYIIPNTVKDDVYIWVNAYVKKDGKILEKKSVRVKLPVIAKAKSPDLLSASFTLDGLLNPRNVTLQNNPARLTVTVRPSQSGTMKVAVENYIGSQIASKNFYAFSGTPKTVGLSVKFPQSVRYFIKVKQKIVEAGIAKYVTLMTWPVTVSVPGSPYYVPLPEKEKPELPKEKEPVQDIEKEVTKEVVKEKKEMDYLLGAAAVGGLLLIAYIALKG